MKSLIQEKFKFYCLLIIIPIISACHFNSQYINRDQDKNDAEKITNLFYNDVKNGTISDKTFELFSSKFWKSTDEEEFASFLINIQKELGILIEVKLDNWNTKVVEGTDPIYSYELTYLNTYEKCTAQETITLERENGVIKIVRYDISSNGFISE
jgi:hypothetical protein